MKLLGDFRAAHGVEPDITVRLIDDSQCSVVNFLKAQSESGAAQPKLALDKDVLKSDEAIRGTIEGINGRDAWLMLVDAQGATYDLSAIMRDRPDGTTSFALKLRPNTPNAVGDLVPQMIVVVATDEPLQSAKVPSGTTAESLLPIVSGELTSRGLAAGAAVAYFRFDTE